MTSSVVELRQYTLHPGQRDVLIDLFDREFVEPQEDVGIEVIGQFRDEDDPDRFVWLRGFPDMAARHAALTAYYVEGAVWRQHRAAAVATMIDSDDVLLLRPVGSPVPQPDHPRPPVGASDRPPSLVTVTVYHLAAADADFPEFFRSSVRPVLAETGASPVACFETEPAENTVTWLPVRAGENVFGWLAAFPDPDHHQTHVQRLAASSTWNDDVLPTLTSRLTRPPENLRLRPTARSLLR